MLTTLSILAASVCAVVVVKLLSKPDAHGEVKSVYNGFYELNARALNRGISNTLIAKFISKAVALRDANDEKALQGFKRPFAKLIREEALY
ncbi:hypothetical protein NVP1215B_050 [Vibrio phage 1.215.B._10N.222.54.F7]|nr:hypothetical protein NVP1215A_050 [Vibrio phage 1.215.A._10N.222.54.F7]AUR96073.1 hypothetical protein NVP1215B_050 [Vibrio phage 1.215.B._10N.222.54.F7]